MIRNYSPPPLRKRKVNSYHQILKRTRFGLLVFLVLSSCGFSEAPSLIKLAGSTMGTRYSIKIPEPPNSVDSVQIKSQIEGVLGDINEKMSNYLDHSNLSLFNSHESIDWQTIPADLYEVLKLARTVSRKSAGAFDITVGPLVNLWGFGSDKFDDKAIPPDHEIDSRLQYTGYQHIEIRRSPFGIKKDDPRVQVDLSAIAKGYGVDLVTKYLESIGIKNYMVEIGGEIRVLGVNEKRNPWRIAIEKPIAGMRSVYRILKMTSGSIATSGDYRNFFDHNGQRFSHTIDPRTGKPITHSLASVSVVGHTSAYADAMATALMVLGPEEGFELAEQEGLAAIFLIRSENGFVEKTTTGFQEEVGI